MFKRLKALFQRRLPESERAHYETTIQALRARLDLAEGVCEALEEQDRAYNYSLHFPTHESIKELEQAVFDTRAMLSVWQKGTKHND